ncbi:MULTISPECIES: hypothetical protein [unclassified Nocardioides]|uniref:hypothetical protein n=1 Tax=unclassified Nocardioides TaxID=2615069 RepID=UPI0007034C2C|nr:MULTISPECIES: hypothetical protein [unclassified Nocardioides]KRC59621.1 hypothetical protein ASE19_00940 [Nocardioides sp. Root79]KRC68554.1 hypothetical protein ASE20_17020 [Nocardioides sp. Root240]
MSSSRAERLLDAQVAWLVGRLTGDELPALVERDLRALLDLEARITLADLVDAEQAKRQVRAVLTTVPASTGASTVVTMLADVLYDGPEASYTLGDLVAREDLERVAEEALSRTDLVARLLDDVSASPIASTLASRFVGRLVGEVMQSNRAAAEKIPGLGALVALGVGAAGVVAGAADKQLEGVLGMGASFATRRLNRVLVETLKDPAARAAVLEVYDLYADRPIPHLRDSAKRQDVHRAAGLAQDLAISGAASEPVLALADAVVDAFWRIYGEHPATAFAVDLGLDRDALVSQATSMAAVAVAVAHDNGDLERLVRERLEPFYASPEVAAILAEPGE